MEVNLKEKGKQRNIDDTNWVNAVLTILKISCTLNSGFRMLKLKTNFICCKGASKEYQLEGRKSLSSQRARKTSVMKNPRMPTAY